VFSGVRQRGERGIVSAHCIELGDRMAQRGRAKQGPNGSGSQKEDRKGRSDRNASGRSNRRSSKGSSNRSKDAITDAMSDEEARAALETSSKLYYRIGEVSELTAVKAHVLRYWETEFRWMAPPKSRSKQRLYRKRDIEFVWLLKRLLWDERYTIAGARQRIQELGVDEALQLLDQPSGARTPAAGASATPAGGNDPSEGDLSAFQSGLGELKTRLLALREELAASA
jgi:DNA-binding transcriptional MerR regulator